MNGRQLLAEIRRHGKVERVHTRPVRAGSGRPGWANTLVCTDGWTYTTTARQDAALIRAMDEETSAAKSVARQAIHTAVGWP